MEETGDARLARKFELSYEEHRARIYRTIRGIVLDAAAAEDLTQETFEKAFRWSRRGREADSMSALLHRIAVNAAISHTRRQRLTRLLPLRLLTSDTASASEHVEQRSQAERALAALSAKLRAVVVLQFYGGMSREEIAGILDIPVGTVSSRMGAAMQIMRRTLSEDEGGSSAKSGVKGNAS